MKGDRLQIGTESLLSVALLSTAPTSEEERLWALVKDNAADFNSWTELIQETEKSVSPLMICLSSLHLFLMEIAYSYSAVCRYV